MKDKQGYTPLHRAVTEGQKGCVESLVKRDPRTLWSKDLIRQTPIHLAAKYGKKDSLEVMLGYPEGVTESYCTAENGNTPLHMAAENGHEDCVEVLVRDSILDDDGYSTSPVDVKNTNRFYPIHLAAMNGHTKCVEILATTAAIPAYR